MGKARANHTRCAFGFFFVGEVLAMIYRRSHRAFVVSFVFFGVGCSSSETSAPPSHDGLGGQTGSTGGVSATGGRIATAGNSAAAPTGGATNAGTGGSNAPASGGSATGGSGVGLPTGGSVTLATGGKAAGGATSASTGGTGAIATGGKPATGGATSAATGGASTTATGGKGSTGGATSAATGGKSSTGGTSSAATGGKSSTGGTAAAIGGSTSTSTTGCDIWVATTGSDSAAGTTESTAVATVAHGYDLLCPAPPSGSANGTPCQGTLKTLCIKPGTYTMTTRLEFKKTRMGTASRVITIQGDPNSAARPILDFSTQPRVSCGANPSDGNLGGLTINADYYAIKRLEIKGANDNCIKAQGAHGLVENVAVHECADAGIQIGTGSGYTGSGTYNTILNCDSYDNVDTQCDGENADGFGAKEDDGVGNVFRGCRSWNNTDDGWDFYGWSAPITVENCWAISMGKTTTLSSSDGNGFKLGGNSVSAAHVLKDLYSTDNKYGSSGRGFTNNSNPAAMSCAGTCASWGNKAADQGVANVGTTAPSGATAAKMISAARNADGSLPAITAL